MNADDLPIQSASPSAQTEFRMEAIRIPQQVLVPGAAAFTLSISVGAESLSSTIDHVSNIEYVRWIDRIAEIHGTSCGYSREQLLAEGTMWFVARHEVDYLAEVFVGDNLAAATWFSLVGRTTLVRETAIWNRTTEVVVCRASSRWVFVGLDNRKAIRIPTSQLNALQSFAE